MKQKTTRKFLKENYKVLDCGNGKLQNLLRFENADYYCTRVEGWAFDAYIFGDYALIDGYAPIGKYVDRELLKLYDNKADEAYMKWKSTTDFSQESYEKIRKQLHNMISDFLGDAQKRRK